MNFIILNHIYNILKLQDWYYNILPSYDNVKFKKTMRMYPKSFKSLANYLKII
jgi:hypothetical protein